MSSAFFLTNFTKDKLLAHWWRTAAWNKPATAWWGLFNVVPNEVAGSGTEVTTGATGYVRIQMNPADAAYAAPASGADSGRFINNSLVIQFGGPVALDWGVMAALGRFDAAAAGNLEGWMPITSQFFVHAGDSPPFIPIGGMTFNLP